MEKETTRFWCSIHRGEHPADVLVKSSGVRNFIYPTCYDSLEQVVRDRLGEDDRADIQVRNARTWHSPRG